MSDTVPNPYKSALATAIGRARPHAQNAATMLDQAIQAMQGKAWVSPTADTFFAGLKDADDKARAGGEACVAELQRVHDGEPDQVERHAWQTHWRNL
ncbi:hypothetical protein [Streptomyces sp. T028]|uniref:hypothetical protein n=1 Tax=Streptomyces sp. T028 TaxID=3394379 RepID=UPI003A8818FC